MRNWETVLEKDDRQVGGRWRTVLAVFLLFGISTTIVMAGGGDEARRVKFISSSRWMWVNSGVWDGERLVVVDTLAGRGREFRLSGNRTEMREVEASRLVPEGSWGIQRIEDGYLVQVSGTGFVRLAGDFRRTKKIDLEKPARVGAQGRIRWVFSWAPLGEKALLAYGEVETDRRGRRIRGFVWVPLDDPSGFKILHQVTDSSAWIYYRVGYPYVASAAGRGYFVDMAPRPARLYEVDREGTTKEVKLKDAGELDHRGTVSEGEGPDRARTLFARLQAAAMPAGIYGSGRDLFLLRREPEAGASRWTLERLDRGAGAFLAGREVKSRAAHLTVIPGTTFAFLEKGPVQGVGEQEITGALLLPRCAIP